MTIALKLLEYGILFDVINDYVRIEKRTTIESLKRFVKIIVEIPREEYLRRSTNENVVKLLVENKHRNSPKMLRNIDSMQICTRSGKLSN